MHQYTKISPDIIHPRASPWNSDNVLDNGMKVIWIIWGAMFASLGIYIIVAHMVGDQIKMQDLAPDVFSVLRNVLYAVAIVEFAIIPFIRKKMLKSGARTTQTPDRAMPGAGNHPATAKYASVTVISLALAESIAIYGLLLYFLGKDFQSLYMLTAISAAAMIIHRPKMEELEDLALALRGDRRDRTDRANGTI